MAVRYCYLCQQEPFAQRAGETALEEGDTCPVCYQPTCRRHLTTVRWRWRSSGETDSALICRQCQRSYAHRTWDAHNR
ncbi:MAG: hypothetical protein KC415_15375, partial [Anaerolineales bacterium]|nr:hypothetical protein [Anaerolineales bacterium]